MTGAGQRGGRRGDPGGYEDRSAESGDRHARRRERDGRRARAGDDPVTVADAIGAVVRRLGMERPDVVATIFARWDELVGPAMAAHVRPQRVDGQTLVVVADHPAWATQTRHLAPDVLARIAERCGPATVPTRVDVRVRRG